MLFCEGTVGDCGRSEDMVVVVGVDVAAAATMIGETVLDTSGAADMSK